jgi:hypothetical protein
VQSLTLVFVFDASPFSAMTAFATACCHIDFVRDRMGGEVDMVEAGPGWQPRFLIDLR